MAIFLLDPFILNINIIKCLPQVGFESMTVPHIFIWQGLISLVIVLVSGLHSIIGEMH